MKQWVIVVYLFEQGVIMVEFFSNEVEFGIFGVISVAIVRIGCG